MNVESLDISLENVQRVHIIQTIQIVEIKLLNVIIAGDLDIFHDNVQVNVSEFEYRKGEERWKS